MTKVTVHAPFKSDLGKSIIRIREDLMKELKLTDGDFIQIDTEKMRQYAKSKPMTATAGAKYSVRLDFPFLRAFNITYGDSVDITKP